MYLASVSALKQKVKPKSSLPPKTGLSAVQMSDNFHLGTSNTHSDYLVWQAVHSTVACFVSVLSSVIGIFKWFMVVHWMSVMSRARES